MEKYIKTNNFSVPLAIIIAGALIAGAIFLSLRSNGALQQNTTGIISNTKSSPFSSDQNFPKNSNKVEIAVVDTDPSLGSPDAPVTMILFADFECPFCARFQQETMSRLVENEVKSGKVRFIWKDFPLSIHNYAEKTHEAGRCSQEQGKFWEYHDIIFANQQDLTISALKRYASELNLSQNTFDSCLDSGKYKNLVQKGIEEGFKAGVNGTPSFLINGKLVVGALPYETFVNIINQIINKQ